jgi:hypothetical protein
MRHWLYITRCAGFAYYKIGIAKNPWNRLSGMQTACPFELKLFKLQEYPTEREARGAEKQLHKELKEYLYRGEWHKLTEAQAESIEMPRIKELKKRPHRTHLTCWGKSKLGIFNWAGN